jgi:hypothetical protein
VFGAGKTGNPRQNSLKSTPIGHSALQKKERQQLQARNLSQTESPLMRRSALPPDQRRGLEARKVLGSESVLFERSEFARFPQNLSTAEASREAGRGAGGRALRRASGRKPNGKGC